MLQTLKPSNLRNLSMVWRLLYCKRTKAGTLTSFGPFCMARWSLFLWFSDILWQFVWPRQQIFQKSSVLVIHMLRNLCQEIFKVKVSDCLLLLFLQYCRWLQNFLPHWLCQWPASSSFTEATNCSFRCVVVHKTLHADLLLAGITQLLTVIVADKIHQHQYIRSLKPLIA